MDDGARVGLAVDECIRRGSHDGMDIGSMGSGGDKVKSWLSYGARYFGNFRAPSRAITRDNYTKVPKQNRNALSLSPSLLSPPVFYRLSHVWPSLEKNGERRKEEIWGKKNTCAPEATQLPNLSTSPAQSSPHQLPQIVPPLLQ